MKYPRIKCVLFFLTVISTLAFSQHKQINFIENKTLNEAFRKAIEVNKLIFVDCSTTWCPPCRGMEKNVFTLDSVAVFFNTTFVNIKLNMDLPEGKKHIDRYQIGAYPTYLLLDSKGTLLYKFIGGMPADKFMEKIKEGLNPKNRVFEYNKIYESGNYNHEFIREYICLKLDLAEQDVAKEIARKYVDQLTPTQRVSKENWFLYGENKYEQYLSNVKSQNVDYLMEHWDEFVKENGTEKVYSKIAETYRKTTEWVLNGWYFKDFGRNEKDFLRYKELVQATNIPNKEQYAVMMDIAAACCKEDTLTAGNLLADHIGEFTADNQQIMLSFITLSPSYKKHPRFDEMAQTVIEDGKASNLLNYLKSIYPTIQSPKEAEKYDVPNLIDKIGSTAIIPLFHPKKPLYWYFHEDSNNKKTYYSFDASKGKTVLYDSLTIDSLLIEQNISNRRYITFSPRFTEDGLDVDFSCDNKNYVYHPDSQTIAVLPPQTYPYIAPWGISPDKQYEIHEENHNLFIRRIGTEAYHPLSFDGTSDFEFNSSSLTWVGDHAFYITRKDERHVRKLAIIRQLQTPPTANTYNYELPGDTAVAREELYLYNGTEEKLQLIDTHKWKDQQLEVLNVKDVSDKIFFIRRKRTREQLELCYVDLNSLKVKIVFHEESKPYINEEMFSCEIVNQGKDIFMWSDRSGWGHYYHYSIEGKLLNPVTQGSWTAGKICKIDPLKQHIYLYGYGREKGMNPNYTFLYKVDFKGKKIRLLTTENANHYVYISPGLNLIVDNCSRIDTLPQTKVYDINGRLLATTEKPDISRLFEYGWKMPEQFVVKAADGKTDLYGIMWKPFDFDPNKKYPIISQVYPGPQTETVWTDFTVIDRYNNTALAQRGFIVVCMGHRGGSPVRNAAYAKYGYGDLRDYALADDKAGLEQLATLHPYIDINRVGIVGHSGGGMMAVGAMCTYPDFYKVAVASSGNYDNTIYNRTWGETYQGIAADHNFTVKTTQELAPLLKGHLLLVTGDADENVHPANTSRLTDALIKANKEFDLLILPGQGHNYEEPYKSYFEKKKRDYFTRHL